MHFAQTRCLGDHTLVGKEVTVELKNDLAITGTLHSVDQYLNIKLVDTRAVNEVKYPHMRYCMTPQEEKLGAGEHGLACRTAGA
ncbi:U6 snRNA-associated Sm LSm2, partial [Haematococcus lacustris]